MTKTTGEPTEAKLCQFGSKTNYPCWREATEADVGDTGLRLCPEHMKVRRLGGDMDGWLHALQNIRAFLQSEAVKDDPYAILDELAFEWHDSLTKRASNAAIKFKVAKFLADQPADSLGPKDPRAGEYGARLMVLSDALDNAYLVLIREHEPSEEDRLAIIAAVDEASKRVDKELEEFKAMNGIGTGRPS